MNPNVQGAGHTKKERYGYDHGIPQGASPDAMRADIEEKKKKVAQAAKGVPLCQQPRQEKQHNCAHGAAAAAPPPAAKSPAKPAAPAAKIPTYPPITHELTPEQKADYVSMRQLANAYSVGGAFSNLFTQEFTTEQKQAMKQQYNGQNGYWNQVLFGSPDTIQIAAAFMLAKSRQEAADARLQQTVSSALTAQERTLSQIVNGPCHPFDDRIEEIVKRVLQEQGLTKENQEAEAKENEIHEKRSQELEKLVKQLAETQDHDEKMQQVAAVIQTMEALPQPTHRSADERDLMLTLYQIILKDLTKGVKVDPTPSKPAPKEQAGHAQAKAQPKQPQAKAPPNRPAASINVDRQVERQATRNWQDKEGENSEWTQAKGSGNTLKIDGKVWTIIDAVGDGACALHSLMGTYQASEAMYQCPEATRATFVQDLEKNCQQPEIKDLLKSVLQELFSEFIRDHVVCREAFAVFLNHEGAQTLKQMLTEFNRECVDYLVAHPNLCTVFGYKNEEQIRSDAEKNKLHPKFFPKRNNLPPEDEQLALRAQSMENKFDSLREQIHTNSEALKCYFEALRSRNYWLNVDELKMVARIYDLRYYLFNQVDDQDNYVCQDIYNANLTDSNPLIVIHNGTNHYQRAHLVATK